MHTFVAELQGKGGVNVQVNKNILSGNEISEPCFSPVGYLGLSVSYDLRFPELYRKLVFNQESALKHNVAIYIFS